MVKTYVWIVLLGILLTGCRAEETFETISDDMALPAMAQPMELQVQLPGEAALPVVENDSGRLYVCQDYEILLQTLEAGDLNATMEAICGYSRENLTVMETFLDGVSRYEFVWASAGETGDRVGRGVILDDGHYHYCLSALWNADSTEKGQTNWDQVFSSFSPAV